MSVYSVSDNRRRFVAIHNAIKKLYPYEPCGNLARHLTTLAMLISGIVASKRTHLPAIAFIVPTLAKVESRVKRFSRWIDNERVEFESYYLPYAQQLVDNLANQTLVLVLVDPARDRAARLRSSDAQHLSCDGILLTSDRDVVAEQLRLF